MDPNLLEDELQATLKAQQKHKKYHIPYHDVDDLAFKNRHDPNFVASITNLMQVPASITLSNGNANGGFNQRGYEKRSLAMDIPEKLTADGILQNRPDLYYYDDDVTEINQHDKTVTPPSTPTKLSFIENMNDGAENLSKTPQIAADLFKRMRPRRSSIEVDLHAEIRVLRDRINILEHECQVNTRSCRVFYTILCGYVLVKTFSWLVGKK